MYASLVLFLEEKKPRWEPVMAMGCRTILVSRTLGIKMRTMGTMYLVTSSKAPYVLSVSSWNTHLTLWVWLSGQSLLKEL